MLEKNYKANLKNFGNKGENFASEFLEENGYKIIERNFLCHQGEIDIIAKKDKEYIFCEVKSRRNKNFGNAIDAITPYKKKHIWSATKYYLYKNNLLDVPIRFDVIEVYISGKDKVINHIKNVEMDIKPW